MNYTSETIRLDPTNGSVKDSEKNVHLQASDNMQKKKVSSFQITSIRPTSRSSNDADAGEDSENDTEDTSDILDISRNKDLEQETPSLSEDFSKSEEVFINPQLNISGIPNAEDGIASGRLSHGMTVNVTEGGLALAKTDGALNDWQKRFKIVKISSNEKFQRGRWVCFDFNDSPAVSASESKSEGGLISNENTVVIPNSDPNMPGFLQVPIPVITGEASQPITPIAVHYPSTETIVQGTISMSTTLKSNNDQNISDHTLNTPYYFQANLPQPNYISKDSTSSYSPLHTSVIHTEHSNYSQTQESKNLKEEIPTSLQNVSSINQISKADSSHLQVTSSSYTIPQVGEPIVSQAQLSSNSPSQTTQPIVSIQSSDSTSHQVLGHTISSHSTTKQMTLPGISASSSNIAHSISQSTSLVSSIGTPVSSAPSLTSAQPPIGQVVYSHPDQLLQSQISNSSIDSHSSVPQSQKSASLHLSTSAVVSSSSQTVTQNVETISISGEAVASNVSQEDAESASSASTVAIDNKIEQAMDLVKSHLMFAVREEVEVLKEKIIDLMETINNLEYENTILRQYAPPEALQQLAPVAKKGGGSAPHQN